jgi:uncharacterized protein (UPF0335 family)
MPKGAKINDDIGGHEMLPDTTAPANSKGAQLRDFLDRIMGVYGDIDTVMNEAKRKCAPHREDIKQIKKDANEAGFSAKELNALVRKERLERKIAAIPDEFDDEQKERYEDMLHALGELAELPLGQAAAEKHPDHQANGAAKH